MNPLVRDPANYQRTPVVAAMPSTKAAGQGVVTMRLYDPIDPWGEWWGISAKEFTATLDALPEDTKEIRLLINSPGGHVWDGLAILNALRNHPAKVVAVVEGIAASSASFIAAGADETHVMANSRIFVHKAWGGCLGNADDMAKMADDLGGEDRNLAAIYAGKAGGSVEDWLTAMAAETFYNADEAVAAGLADKVIEPAKDSGGAEAAMARFDLSVFAHTGRGPSNSAEVPPTEPAVEPTPVVVPPEPQPIEPVPGDEPAPDSPAAEPEPNTEPKEDPVSDLSEYRSRLGLDDTADEAAVLAAIDALKVKAETEPEPDPDLVAAATKAAEENATLAEKVSVLTEQVQEMSAELSATKAEKAASVKASVFDAAVRDGKLRPADRAAWEARYDKAPDVITDVLASIAPGTAVPVQASGYTGADAESASVDDEYAKLVATLDGPLASKGGAA